MIISAYKFIIYTPPNIKPNTLPIDSNSPAPTEKPSTLKSLRRIDFPGAILLAIWLSTLLIAITLKSSTPSNQTENQTPSFTFPLLLAVSGVTFLLFLLVELRLTKSPIMPFELLHRRTPIAVALNNFLMSVYTFALLYSFPVYLQAVKGFSAGKSGRYLIVYGFVGMVSLPHTP
jgi:hypothetical protein